MHVPLVYDSVSLILKEIKNTLTLKAKFIGCVLFVCPVLIFWKHKQNNVPIHLKHNTYLEQRRFVSWSEQGIVSQNSWALALWPWANLSPFTYVGLTICYMFITTLTCLSELLLSSANVCLPKKKKEKHFYVQGIIHVSANHLG